MTRTPHGQGRGLLRRLLAAAKAPWLFGNARGRGARHPRKRLPRRGAGLGPRSQDKSCATSAERIPRGPASSTLARDALLLAVLAEALALLSCVATPMPTAPAPTLPLIPLPSPTPLPVEPIRVLLPQLPESLDPLAASSWASRALRSLFLPGLWTLDDRLQPYPVLADSLPSRANGGIAENGQALTLRLRPDLRWSDGHPLTAEDVVFTWEYAAAEGIFPYASFVERVTALDARTIRVEFARPFAPWPAHLFTYILPRHILESGDAGAWRAFPSVGSGPYVPAYWEGGGLVFRANPFWQGPLPAGRLVVYQETRAPARWNAIAEGKADLTVFPAPESLPADRPPEGAILLTAPSGYVETLFFNLDPRRGHPALQSERVRAALAGVLDRDALCPMLGGQAVPAWTLYSGTFWEHPGLTGPVLSPAQARRLLDEAGWRDTDGDGIREWQGIPLRLRYAVPTGEVSRGDVQARVAQRWREIGVQVETATVDRPWEDPTAWDVAQWAGQVPGYPDPDDPRWLCGEARPGGQNVAGICDERLDELIAAQAAAVDPEDRRGLLFEIQALAGEQGWWVPLCRWEDFWLVRKTLAGLRPWREAPFWNLGK